MRNNKNNITFNVRNITLNYKILISYFTEKRKIITLSLVILILSSINLINVSALSYSSNVGIGFTFNPTLSISLSSSDLTISNLTPGATSDSNSININIATNAAYGYNLSANVGNSTYNNTSLNNINNSNDSGNASNVSSSVFSSIDTNASLASLTIDNTWGYSYRLTDNNGSSNAWSNYSGLPLYSSNNSKTLIDKYTQSEDTVNFKIAARASNTQPSGTYSNVINFIAISYASPMSLSDSYAYFGKELYHGYYKMQDMTTRICQTTEAPSELQVIDVRDDKVYWIAKLADGNCWMTQNLDLCIGCEDVATLTSENTDLNESGSVGYGSGYTNVDGVITWTPVSTAITSSHTIDINELVNDWADDPNIPYSVEGGDFYYYTNDLDQQYTPDIVYDSISVCTEAGHTAEQCMHYHIGNYYNQTTAIASNNSRQLTTQYSVAANSICPAGWRLPKGAAAAEYSAATHEFSQLFYTSGITVSLDSTQYDTDGFLNIRKAPLYFVRSGRIYSGKRIAPSAGCYNSSTILNNAYFYNADFERRWTTGVGVSSRAFGKSVRCLAR